MGWMTARPLAHYLMLLVLSILIPASALTAGFVWHTGALDRTRVDDEALQLARTVAGVLDMDIESSTETLLALGTSQMLRQGNLEGFYRQASEAMSLRSLHVLLRAPSGQQLLNTRVPWGTPIPPQTLSDSDQQVLKSRKPVISNLVVGAVTKQWVLSLSVPVLEGTEVRYILSMSIDAEHIRRIVAATPRSLEWIIAVSDRTGRLIARSHEHEAYLGREIHPDVKGWSRGPEGVHRTQALAGYEVVRGYHWSPRSGWLVAAFVPTEVVEGPLRRMWFLFALVTASVTALSLPLAYFLSRRIAGPVADVASYARALGRGEPAVPPTSGLEEANLLSAALATASREVLERSKALAANELRFRSVFEQSAVGFDQVDLDGRLVGVNDRLCKLLGFTREECLQKTFKVLTHPDDQASEEELIGNLLSGKIPHYEIEKRLITKSGAPVWVQVTSSIVRDQDGKPLYRTSVVEDVTERRRAREEAARLAAIVQTSQDAIFSTTRNGIIETWNPGAERLLGYTPDEVMGQSKSILVPKDRTHEFESHIRVAMAGNSVNAETIRRHKDGTLIDVSLSVVPIRENGRIRSLSVTMEDIRDRKRRESHIMLLNRELAHRVKNTLAVVQSIANQTMRSTPDPGTFRAAFQGRLQSLAAAHDLLMQTSWGGVALRDFIERQMAPLMPCSALKIAGDSPAVVLPADLSIPLGLALHELGTNAIKHGAWSTSAGEVLVAWELAYAEASGDGRRLVLTWSEHNGPLIEPPVRRGFGTILIERGIPGARVTRRFDPSGIVCTIDLPLG